MIHVRGYTMADSIKPENELSGEQLRQSIEEILQRLDALPAIAPADPDEVLSYDENGLAI